MFSIDLAWKATDKTDLIIYVHGKFFPILPYRFFILAG